MNDELQSLIESQAEAALAEDVGDGDISAALIDADARLDTELLLREDAVLCGCRWFDAVFRRLDPGVASAWRHADGDESAAGTVVCTVAGPARPILTGERSALNFLQTLSGTATLTRRYAARIAHTRCRVLDTRKTLPLLRRAQKYAVRCGGGHNHRIGLFDAYLVKENHLAAGGGIAATVAAARRARPDCLLEVEVETEAQLREAIAAGVDRVLLDNFGLDGLRAAAALNAGRVELEASGNVDLDNIAAIAETGVDYVSVGALTKHLRAIDFSLRFR